MAGFISTFSLAVVNWERERLGLGVEEPPKLRDGVRSQCGEHSWLPSRGGQP